MIDGILVDSLHLSYHRFSRGTSGICSVCDLYECLVFRWDIRTGGGVRECARLDSVDRFFLKLPQDSTGFERGMLQMRPRRSWKPPRSISARCVPGGEPVGEISAVVGLNQVTKPSFTARAAASARFAAPSLLRIELT